MKHCDECGADYEGEEHTCPEPQPEPQPDLTGVRGLLDEIKQEREKREKEDADLERRIGAILDKAAGGDPETPSKKERKEPRVQVFDVFDQLGYTQADYELAGMIFGGTRQVASTPTVEPSEEFVRAWRANVLEAERVPIIGDGDDHPVRAMDAQETGYGLELIGAQYVRDLWEAARNNDSIVGRIRDIPMADPTVYVPIDGDLPEMLYVGESTSASATAYTTSKTASSRVSLSAKKFTIQQIWSAELNEDSIIAFTPFLRAKLNMSAALYLGSAYLNGDTTNAGTGNINLDDANPDDTKHYLAWNGIRYYWITDATGQGKDMAAEIDPAEILRARGKLNAGDDDVDNLVKNINWGLRAEELLCVCDWDTYMNLLELDAVKTVDKYGAQATLVTGELGRIYGIPVIAPSYCTKTEADGKCSDTEASNTKGQITVFNPNGWLGGVRRGVQLFFDRIQRTDQFLFELYTRRAFTKFGGNVAAGVYDITVS